MQKLTLALALTMIVMCARHDVRTPVSSETLALSAAPQIITLPDRMRGRAEYVSVLMKLEESWKPVAPFTSIELGDGSLATLKVEVNSMAGRTYRASVFGKLDGYLEARLGDQLQKGVVSELRISSDKPVTVTEVLWRDWNP